MNTKVTNFWFGPVKMHPAENDITKCSLKMIYEGQLISNAHSEISRKIGHVFKQKKVGSKVQYFSYKLTYFF